MIYEVKYNSDHFGHEYYVFDPVFKNNSIEGVFCLKKYGIHGEKSIRTGLWCFNQLEYCKLVLEIPKPKNGEVWKDSSGRLYLVTTYYPNAVNDSELTALWHDKGDKEPYSIAKLSNLDGLQFVSNDPNVFFNSLTK